MLNIYNEGFISYINLFLLLTLHYSAGFSQILIQILMEKLGIRILIIISCWNINNTINFPSWLESSVSLDYFKRYKVVLSKGCMGRLFTEFKSHSENLAKIKKDCPWLEPIFKKLLRRG